MNDKQSARELLELASQEIAQAMGKLGEALGENDINEAKSVWCDMDALKTRIDAHLATPESEKHEMHWIDATPDEGYIQRILQSYIDESFFTDNTLGLTPSNPICILMNKNREERNSLLKEALKKLASREPGISAPSGSAMALRVPMKVQYFVDAAALSRFGILSMPQKVLDGILTHGYGWSSLREWRLLNERRVSDRRTGKAGV